MILPRRAFCFTKILDALKYCEIVESRKGQVAVGGEEKNYYVSSKF